MIRNSTANDLVDAFMQFLDLEKHLENAKIKLVEHSDFNLFDAFKLFDTKSKGYLTISELATNLINALEIVPSTEEIDLVFTRYDKDRDGQLRFSEFCDAFVPYDRSY